MQNYIGTKIIGATPMTANAWEKKAKLILREIDEPGYLVRYANGYESWSPKGVFDDCHRKVSSEEMALLGVKSGTCKDCSYWRKKGEEFGRAYGKCSMHHLEPFNLNGGKDDLGDPTEDYSCGVDFRHKSTDDSNPQIPADQSQDGASGD